MTFLWHNSLSVFISSTLYVRWLNLRLRLTFTTSQDALRKGGTGWSSSPAGQEQAGIMSVRVERWPHNIVPSTCIYVTAPAPPVLVRPERKRCGQTDFPPPRPPPPLSREAGWGDRPELRSDFGGRKGEGRGASDKSAAVALFYPFSPLNCDPGLCVMNATEVELLHTQSRASSNLVTILFSNNTGLLLRGASIQISVVQEKQNEAQVMQRVERLLPLQPD